jgi:hypothetical protein
MQALKKKKLANTSLKRRRTPRTVLLRMAADADRAERIRSLKEANPQVRWRMVADYVGVTDRSVADWASKGAMSYDHAKKLAEFFKVDLDWLWRGPEQQSPDLMTALSEDGPQSQLDDIQRKLDELLTRLPSALDDRAGVEAETEERARQSERTAGESAAGTRGRQRKARRRKPPG